MLETAGGGGYPAVFKRKNENKKPGERAWGENGKLLARKKNHRHAKKKQGILSGEQRGRTRVIDHDEYELE